MNQSPNKPPTPNRHRSWNWVFIVLIVLVALGVVAAPYLLGRQAQQASAAEQQANNQLGPAQTQASLGQNLANKISVACTNKALLAQLQALGACQTANQIHAVPGPTGPPGQNGQPGQPGAAGSTGRGITNTFISDSHLFVVYTDGTTKDLGQVVGAQGPAGQQGISIVNTALGGTSGTHLIITYSDNNSVDVGNVVGSQGAPGTPGAVGPSGPTGIPGASGTNGAAGNSVSSVTINAQSHLIVAFTDGSTQDAGLVPAGPQGPPGVQGAQGVGVQSIVLDTGGSTGCEFTFTLVNPANGSLSTQHVAINNVLVCVGAGAPTTTSPPPTTG